MSSIDDRIVQMQFDNGQFEKGIKQTNESLASLKDGLKLDGATAGLTNIQNAANKFDLGKLATGVDRISGAFTGLGIIGINVLSRLTQDAISFGAGLISRVLDPIVQGGERRALALEQAKFQFKGLGLDIEATMAAALGAVKGTAFGLDDAATAAAQFGASGITAGKGLQESLRAIAGVAAQTGSSYSDVARTFESVAGNGRLMGQDLLSLSARGVNAAAVLAKALGKTESSVRDMVSAGDISFKMFSKAMGDAFGDNAVNANQTYSGSVSNLRAALSRVGATVATPKFEAQRKVINATTPVVDALHEALKPLLVAFGNLMNVNADALVIALGKINFDQLIKTMPAVLAVFDTLVAVVKGILKPLRDAFAMIFPPATTEQLLAFVGILQKFVSSLKLTNEQTASLQLAFAGFFAIFSIGFQIIGRLVGVFANLLGYSAAGSNGILSFSGTIGAFLVKLDRAIKTGEGFNNFFEGLERVLKVPISFLLAFANGVQFIALAIESLIMQKGIERFADGVKERFSGLIALGEFFKTVFEGIKKILEFVLAIISPFVLVIVKAAESIGKKVGEALGKMSFDDGIKAINTGLFGAFLLILNGFFGNLGGVLQGNGVAFVTKFKLVFGQLQLNLKALEMNVNAKTILTIAAAVALLAVSAIALAMVDPVRLGAAMAAITVGFGQLLASFALIQKMPLDKGFIKVPLIVGTLIALSIAMNILAIAVTTLSKLSWNDLAKGLTGATVVMAAMVGAALLLGKSGPQVVVGAVAITILASALRIMVESVEALASLSWADLAKGLLGVSFVLGIVILMTQKIGNPLKILPTAVAILLLAGALRILSIATVEFASLSFEDLAKGIGGLTLTLIAIGKGLELLPKNLIVSGGAIILVAVGLKILVSVIQDFSKLSPEEIARGLITLAGSLGILVVALNAMDTTLVGAASLVIASAALIILAQAMKELGSISWDEIGRGLVVLGVSLGILVIALALMGQPASLLGSAALLIAAAALMILAPALVLLGTMSWDSIGAGLGILAAAIGVIALGGLLLIPAIPGLLGLGLAIGLLGVGMLAAGTAMGLFAAGLVVLTAGGTAAIALIGPAIDAFAQKIPLLATQIGVGVGAIAVEITKQTPVIVLAIVTVLLGLIKSINDIVPPLIGAAVVLVTAFVKALVALVPLLVDAGLKLVVGILSGVGKNIGQIVTKGTDIIVNFINGIAAALPRLLLAGANLIISFINGLADTIRAKTSELQRAGLNLASAIIEGMASGLSNGFNAIVRAAQKLVSGIGPAIKKLLGINSPSKLTTDLGEFTGQGLVNGLLNMIGGVDSAAKTVGQTAVTALKDSISGLSDAVNANVDIQPSIRPVLDLSAIKKDSGMISGMLSGQTLSVGSIKASAVSANVNYDENRRVSTDADGTANNAPQPAAISFTQINNSPKALTNAEIYRQTKSQLAVVKGELDK